MSILTIRTDKPEAEIGLYDKAGVMQEYLKWEAHRQLAETLHGQIKKLVDNQQAGWKSITGIVVYAGPGSFTGLRIGVSVANVPITAAPGDDWIKTGITKILNENNHESVVPFYGADVNITTPKK
jgi:tRNA threonylcarbamoyladenosine biosynthesis protein TsaB